MLIMFMSDISLSVEDRLEFEKFKEEHKAVFENEEIDAVGNWGFKSQETDNSPRGYISNGKNAIKGLGNYFKTVFN